MDTKLNRLTHIIILTQMPVPINWFRIVLLFCILLLLHTHRFIATDGKFQFLFIVLSSSNNMTTIVQVCMYPGCGCGCGCGCGYGYGYGYGVVVCCLNVWVLGFAAVVFEK